MQEQDPIGTVVQCHKCQKRLKYTGKKPYITCPGCGERLAVQSVFAESRNADSELERALNGDPMPIASVANKENGRTVILEDRNSGWITAICWLGGIAIGLLACLMSFYPITSNRNAMAPNPIEKEFQLLASPSFAPAVVSGKFYGNHGAIETHIHTKNSTTVAIESVVYCVEVLQENRQVPLSKKYTSVRIPGGIEPSETKSIQANVSADVFPDEPGENTGRFIRVSLVSYVPHGQSSIDVTNAVSCRCKYFDAYDQPQDSVGVSDNSATATNGLEALFRKLDADARQKPANGN